MSSAAITVRPLAVADRAPWLAMRRTLYVEVAGDEDVGLEEDIDTMLADPGWAAFGAFAADGEMIGLIEMFERNYAEGCSSSPVPYVEGLFVAAGWRRQGVARALLDAGINWAQSRGRTELASDVQLHNLISQAVHARLGFAETERLVTYRIAIA